MTTESAYFRREAWQLVDALKNSDNADLLELFVDYVAKDHKGGWSDFLYPTPDTEPEMVERLINVYGVEFYLTPEQSKRWREMEEPFDYPGNSGHAISIVYLTAQLLLGRLDVVTPDGNWYK